MKRVGLITYQAFTRGQGGGTRYAATIARWARDAGYDVTIIARSPDRESHESTAEGIRIVELGGRHIHFLPSSRLLDKDFAFARALNRYLEREGGSYDFFHSIVPDLTSSIPKRLRPRLIVSVIEDFWTSKAQLGHQLFSIYQRSQAGLAVRDAAVVTLPSRTAEAFFRRQYPDAEKKCRLVYDFVDAELFQPGAGPGPAKPAEGPLFVPQRAVRQKMVWTAIEAFQAVSRAFPGLRLVVAGGGPGEKSLKRLAGRLGMEPRVSFLGSVDPNAMPKLYQSASVVVITSASEGAQPSPTAAEAMACERPLIMTDACDTDRVFKDCVLQYRPGDVEQLASHIRDLLNDYPRALERTRDSRAIILERFSLPAFLARFAEIYRKIIQNSTP